jgi:hypothetical protein
MSPQRPEENAHRARQLVELQQGGALSAGLLDASGAVRPGTVVLLTDSRAAVALAPAVGELLDAGSTVRLVFRVGEDSRPLLLRAVPGPRKEVSGRLLASFRFEEPGALEQQLGSEDWRLFNRRGAWRVTPAEGESVLVEVESGAGRGSGALVDLSVSGLRMEAPAGAMPTVGEDLALQLTLPGALAPLVLVGTAVAVTDGDSSDVHVAFDTGDAGWGLAEEALSDYVLSRCFGGGAGQRAA